MTFCSFQEYSSAYRWSFDIMHRELASAPSAKLSSLPQQTTPTDAPKSTLTVFPSTDEEENVNPNPDDVPGESTDILEKKKGTETIPYPATV